ncbi:Synaptotagmin-5-like protein [Drosera capensis]
MGFVSGIVLGFVFGIGLIVGFARCQRVRAERRSELLGWLNQQLEKLWPYIDEAASELIRSSVEPIIEQYRPPILASIEFSELTLGTVAPQFTGICMVDTEPGEIIIEVDIQWDGDPNIVFEIKPLVGVALPIQSRQSDSFSFNSFVSYYSNPVPNTIRVTNYHDIVPHLPPYYSRFPQRTYHHFPREVWLYKVGFGSLVYTAEKVCDGSGENPECSRSVMGNSISDHLVYLSVNLQAETWTTCGIVTDYQLADYRKTDEAGNFVLSRNPTFHLNLNTQQDGRGEVASQ